MHQNVPLNTESSVIEDRGHELERGYILCLVLAHFGDEESITEEDFLKGTEGLGTDQCNRGDSSNTFVGPATEGDFVR